MIIGEQLKIKSCGDVLECIAVNKTGYELKYIKSETKLNNTVLWSQEYLLKMLGYSARIYTFQEPMPIIAAQVEEVEVKKSIVWDEPELKDVVSTKSIPIVSTKKTKKTPPPSLF